MKHPHFIERRIVRTVKDRSFGEIDIPGMPLRFSGFPDELILDAPYLGEHNHDVLEGLLAMTATEVDALIEEGVLHAVLPDRVQTA